MKKVAQLQEKIEGWEVSLEEERERGEGGAVA